MSRKSPVLAEMEAKAKSEANGRPSEVMERADSTGKAECMIQTQTQRELAPPWNFNGAEQQLEIMK